ncbi:MAG: M23 family metallopeptidase [Paracoccaceae bacterium]
MRPAAFAAGLALSVAPLMGAADQRPVFSIPIDCDLGETCFIQQYVDRDAGPDVQDYMCSGLSYEGHQGTDFALNTLRDLSRSVDVLAAAPGVVVGARDGIKDQLLTNENQDSVKGRECGNGVLIDHGDGWTSQYCHMAQGSIAVNKGDHVSRGQILGDVGLSGSTQFPHVHMTVRKNGAVIDPFNANASNTCLGTDPDSLWDLTPAYIPGGIIYAGFAAGVPEYPDVKAGTVKPPASVDAPALVIYTYMFGSRPGDRLHLQIKSPERTLVDETLELSKQQAQLFRAVGKRRTTDAWPKGVYTGKVTLVRDGKKIDIEETTISLD